MEISKGKRKWSSWWKRIVEDVSVPEVFIGLVSLGLVLSTQPVFKIPGILASIGIAVFILIRSFPERLLSTAALASSQEAISLDKLGQLDTSVIRIGTVGEGQTGKSTFLNNALLISSEPPKTSHVSVRIVSLPNESPPVFCALVDGDGSQLTQQFEICDNSELLFVFLDHNTSDSSGEKSDIRLGEHAKFLTQLRSHLNRDKMKNPNQIHFILNKRDLWQANEAIERDMVGWFCDIASEWRSFGMAQTVAASQHSNLNASDVRKLLQLIKNLGSR